MLKQSIVMFLWALTIIDALLIVLYLLQEPEPQGFLRSCARAALELALATWAYKAWWPKRPPSASENQRTPD